MLLNERTELLDGGSTLLGDASQLKFRRRGRDVRIKTGTGTRNQINRDRHTGIFSLCVRHIPLHSINKLLIGGPELRAISIRGVVSIARERRPRMKITGSCKPLSNDARSDDLAVFPNQLPISLPRKYQLRQSCNDKGIDDP